MRRQPSRLGLLAVVIASLNATTSIAQSPAPPGAPVCHCAGYVGPHIHLSGPPATRGGMAGQGNPTGNAVSPNEQGLPRGRRYYGGRYFGSFNNRFYGPQYGYF